MSKQIFDLAGKRIVDASKAGASGLPLQTVLQAQSSMMSAWSEYKKTCQVEKTRRAQIDAEKTVRLEALRQRAALMREYMDKIFEERGRNFKHLFEQLDQGIAHKDDARINAAMQLISVQMQTNPLHSAKEVLAIMQDESARHFEI